MAEAEKAANEALAEVMYTGNGMNCVLKYCQIRSWLEGLDYYT
jgi:hypothetical protein